MVAAAKPEQQPSVAELVVSVPREGHRHFVIGEAGATIGSLTGSDIFLESAFVSRKHARIYPEEDGYFIVDTNSRNGVAVNGMRLKRGVPVRLQTEARIDISPYRMFFYAGRVDRQTQPLDTIECAGKLQVNVESRKLLLNDSEIPVTLSKQEFDILAHLYAHAGRVCTRDELGEAVWGTVNVGGRSLPNFDWHMLQALLNRLRKKLEAGGVMLNRYLVTVRGVGYRLEPSGPRNDESMTEP